MIVSSADTLVPQQISYRYHSLASYGSMGSGHDLPLPKFNAVKLPVEFRFPEAALGQGVQPTLSCLLDIRQIAASQMWPDGYFVPAGLRDYCIGAPWSRCCGTGLMACGAGGR